jgi:hypothetical protein
MFIRGNGVTLRTQKVIQGGDNGHVGLVNSIRFIEGRFDGCVYNALRQNGTVPTAKMIVNI